MSGFSIRWLNPRRWIRFRLRTLFALMSLTAVLLGWLGFHARGKQHEQAILSEFPSMVERGESDLLLY